MTSVILMQNSGLENKVLTKDEVQMAVNAANMHAENSQKSE